MVSKNVAVKVRITTIKVNIKSLPISKVNGKSLSIDVNGIHFIMLLVSKTLNGFVQKLNSFVMIRLYLSSRCL